MKQNDNARTRLRIAAERGGERPYGPFMALRKLFFQERRDWSQPGAPRIGWKRGEAFEVLLARSAAERAKEWGDVGYYIAQAWPWLWRVYVAVTPDSIIENAVRKFERRALERNSS